jgi:hypothetical protein
VEKIKKGVIIHGPGRSGTTLLSNILSLHSDFFWISGYVNRFPRLPFLSMLNKVQAMHKIEEYNRGLRKWPRPAEAYVYWDHFFKGFQGNETFEFSNMDRYRCLRSLRVIQKYHGNDRFITKITGASRAKVIDAVFDDPYIIYDSTAKRDQKPLLKKQKI